MEVEGTNKAPKDKCCPYCGQAFTSSSLGRHLDLYIKEKNPKAPDGIHNVEEIRKLRGSITRRQPRGGASRDNSHPRDSQTGSKRNSATSDVDSVVTRSPDTTRSRSNSQKIFNKRMMKSSLEVKQRVQDAIDTAKAAELALREMMSSWKSAKQHIDTKKMPFDFNPLSMDFPALCLQCLEPPPTLFSSTPYSTATSWSITSPGEKQNEALKSYFKEEFGKWKILCSTVKTAQGDELTSSPSHATTHQEMNTSYHTQKSVESARKLELQVSEHLEESFQVWEQLPSPRRQELWVLEMARNIGTRQQEVANLKAAQYSLKQENATLRTQIDHLNTQQRPREYKIVPPLTSGVDEKMAELWSEAGIGGRHSIGSNSEDRQDLNALVSGAIEKWKNVIVTSRAANAMKAQRSLDQLSSSLRTPTSAIQPLSPEESRLGQQFGYQPAEQSYSHTQTSPNAQYGAGRTSSTSSTKHTATTVSEPKTSNVSTPTQTDDDSEEDADADGDDDADADADADVEMGGGGEYLSAANTPAHQGVSQLPQHSIPHHHQMLPIIRAQQQQISSVRHDPYSQRDSPYGHHGVLASQQIQMNQQTFGHQLQNLEHNLAQGHNLGWNNHD
ncbi:hypothetical protein N0V93_002654 [Gnomoniopsis smithogilvyi]|uniref:Uncharacterized protein n=1 Tax=Gnomoniopsis smithogilvyi TaxID=1191159 RepID=A0A9W8YWW0_9PEZI|nr:hypothetical protein N0V93_002654 [Gnomoniopsis smithogilvyi]